MKERIIIIYSQTQDMKSFEKTALICRDKFKEERKRTK